MAMGSMRVEVEKFTGMDDFGLWRVMMHVMLVHQGLVGALEGETKLLKVIKSFLVVLTGTLEENNVYTLDGKAPAFGVQGNEDLAQVCDKGLGQVNETRFHEVHGNKRVQLEVELPVDDHEAKNDQEGGVRQEEPQGQTQVLRKSQLALDRQGKQVVVFTRFRKTSVDVAACDVECAEGELKVKTSVVKHMDTKATGDLIGSKWKYKGQDLEHSIYGKQSRGVECVNEVGVSERFFPGSKGSHWLKMRSVGVG